MINRQNIIEGRGLEEIARLGWGEFREALEQIPYSEIVEAQARRIEQINSAPKLDPDTDFLSTEDNEGRALQSFNRQGLTRLDSLTQSLGNKRGYPYYARYGGIDKFVLGNAKSHSVDERVIRLYFNVRSSHLADAFLGLFESIGKERVNGKSLFEYVELALYRSGFNWDFYSRNCIMVFMKQDAPDEAKQKLAQAVLNAKNRGDLNLPDRYRAQAVEQMIFRFMVPLDDSVGMVELPFNTTYDQGDLRKIAAELRDVSYENLGRVSQTRYTVDTKYLFQLADWLRAYTPTSPEVFSQLNHRRKHLPALVF